jgi:GTPase SAR1 family protein
MSIEKWITQVNSKTNNNVKKILIGNKADVKNR